MPRRVRAAVGHGFRGDRPGARRTPVPDPNRRSPTRVAPSLASAPAPACGPRPAGFDSLARRVRRRRDVTVRCDRDDRAVRRRSGRCAARRAPDTLAVADPHLQLPDRHTDDEFARNSADHEAGDQLELDRCGRVDECGNQRKRRLGWWPDLNAVVTSGEFRPARAADADPRVQFRALCPGQPVAGDRCGSGTAAGERGLDGSGILQLAAREERRPVDDAADAARLGEPVYVDAHPHRRRRVAEPRDGREFRRPLRLRATRRQRRPGIPARRLRAE